MISTKFNTTDNILETKFEGTIKVEELSDYIKLVRETKTLPQELKILSDARKGKFAGKIKRKDLNHFFDENRITLELGYKKCIYDAFIVSSPIEMALGMLYRNLIQIENYKFNIFSTKEAALTWLNTF